MRSTQFIGLTQKCQDQVKDLTAIRSKGWDTFGMFDEIIPLSIFYGKDGSLVAFEYVIASPWSSGPMIFTGLMFAGSPSEHNWKEDIEASGREYDPEKGLYYV
jgi:hypothetical protein